MSDSYDSDTTDSEEVPAKLKKAMKNFADMKPDFKVSKKSKASTYQNLKNRLAKSKSQNTPQRSSTRIDQRKQVEDCFKDLQESFGCIVKKLDVVYDCITNILDGMTVFEQRLTKLEKDSGASRNTATYSQVARTTEAERIEKLEYAMSEEERKKRMLQVSITHPSIDLTAGDPSECMKRFFATTMKMGRRETDPNLNVRKTSRPNTAIISFSDRRFKIFLFSAKRALRQANDQNVQSLYVNDNMTSYNFDMLMEMKRVRKQKIDEGSMVFDSVYSFEGRVYVKRNRQDPNDRAILIKTPPQMKKFIEDFFKVENTSIEPSTSGGASGSS